MFLSLFSLSFSLYLSMSLFWYYPRNYRYQIQPCMFTKLQGILHSHFLSVFLYISLCLSFANISLNSQKLSSPDSTLYVHKISRYASFSFSLCLFLYISLCLSFGTITETIVTRFNLVCSQNFKVYFSLIFSVSLSLSMSLFRYYHRNYSHQIQPCMFTKFQGMLPSHLSCVSLSISLFVSLYIPSL